MIFQTSGTRRYAEMKQIGYSRAFTMV
jgi:hypothetical protein